MRASPIVCPEESPCEFSRRLRSEGVQGASGKPPACIDRRQLCRKKFPRWGMTRRLRRGLGLAVPRGAHTFLSVAKEKCAKESQRHGDSRGGPPRFASRASVCGSRTVGCPEFIRGIQFRPLGRNSLTTFRGQTALRGCPRARGVRCRIAPCRSLCSPPTLPAGRFGLRPRPHWGHASLRDSSLRSPAGKRLLLPILTAGLAISRAMELDSFHQLLECARARLFRCQNGRIFFPPLPIAALLPRSWR